MKRQNSLLGGGFFFFFLFLRVSKNDAFKANNSLLLSNLDVFFH